MEREIPFHVGDFAFFSTGKYGERLVVVWKVFEDGRIEMYGADRVLFAINYFEDPQRIRKPNETRSELAKRWRRSSASRWRR